MQSAPHLSLRSLVVSSLTVSSSRAQAIISGTWNTSLGQSCGYQNLTNDDGTPAFVRQNLSELSSTLLFSLGACEELC